MEGLAGNEKLSVPKVDPVRRPDRHHMFAKEFKGFFWNHGFRGRRHIDNFTVEIDQGTHGGIHGGGGGRWRPGKKWHAEFNNMWAGIIDVAVPSREKVLGRKLTFEEVFLIGLEMQNHYEIEGEFVHYRTGVSTDLSRIDLTHVHATDTFF